MKWLIWKIQTILKNVCVETPIIGCVSTLEFFFTHANVSLFMKKNLYKDKFVFTFFAHIWISSYICACVRACMCVCVRVCECVSLTLYDYSRLFWKYVSVPELNSFLLCPCVRDWAYFLFFSFLYFFFLLFFFVFSYFGKTRERKKKK